MPITILSGFLMSWKAWPSLMNSGLNRTVKSSRFFLSDALSRRGITMFSVVPGSTVLFITIVWWLSLVFNILPIWVRTNLKGSKSCEPSDRVGVPTVMNERSVFWTAKSASSVRWMLFDKLVKPSWSSGSYIVQILGVASQVFLHLFRRRWPAHVVLGNPL